jgi:hypothetical protein
MLKIANRIIPITVIGVDVKVGELAITLISLISICRVSRLCLLALCPAYRVHERGLTRLTDADDEIEKQFGWGHGLPKIRKEHILSFSLTALLTALTALGFLSRIRKRKKKDKK